VALRGSFSDTAPEDLLQILALGRKTGVLSVSDGSRRVDLVFENGTIVDAYDGLSRGTEVVFSLLGTRSGTFVFAPQDVETERTIEGDVQSLLLAGAHQLDNLAHAQTLLRCPTARPYVAEGAQIRLEALPEEDRTVLELIDGRRTLGEIAAGSGLGVRQAYVSLGRLVEEGFVELATASDETSPLAEARPPAATDGPGQADEPAAVTRPPTADELRELAAHLRGNAQAGPGRAIGGERGEGPVTRVKLLVIVTSEAVRRRLLEAWGDSLLSRARLTADDGGGEGRDGPVAFGRLDARPDLGLYIFIANGGWRREYLCRVLAREAMGYCLIVGPEPSDLLLAQDLLALLREACPGEGLVAATSPEDAAVVRNVLELPGNAIVTHVDCDSAASSQQVLCGLLEHLSALPAA
jgi:Domain of unknown function (DUF4388)